MDSFLKIVLWICVTYNKHAHNHYTKRVQTNDLYFFVIIKRTFVSGTDGVFDNLATGVNIILATVLVVGDSSVFGAVVTLLGLQ